MKTTHAVFASHSFVGCVLNCSTSTSDTAGAQVMLEINPRSLGRCGDSKKYSAAVQGHTKWVVKSVIGSLSPQQRG